MAFWELFLALHCALCFQWLLFLSLFFYFRMSTYYFVFSLLFVMFLHIHIYMLVPLSPLLYISYFFSFPCLYQGLSLSPFPSPSFLLHNMYNMYLSNPRPEHTTGDSGRRGARRGGRGQASQNRTPTGRFAKKPTVLLSPQGIVNNCPERLFTSTNKGNSM